MRKNPLLALALVLLLAHAAWSQDISVAVDGRTLTFDQPPLMQGGRILVPLRGIFEALGAEVRWEAPTRTVRATRGASTVVLPLGSPTATVDGRTVPLDAPAGTVNGRTVVPLRFVAEALGAQVKWDGAARRVAITAAAAGPVAAVAVPWPGVVTGTLRPTFRLTFPAGVEPGSARMEVDAVDVTARLQTGPWDVSWTPDYDLSPGGHRVLVTARTAEGNPMSVEWSCQIANGTPDGSQIFSVQLAPEGPIPRGEGLLVTVQAAPGGEVTLQIGDRPARAQEVRPGVYESLYRVQPGDDSDVAVRARLVEPGGRISGAESSERAALRGGPADVAGPPPAPTPPVPPGPGAFNPTLDLPRLQVGNQAGLLKIFDRQRKNVDYFRTLDDRNSAQVTPEQRNRIEATLGIAPDRISQVAKDLMSGYGALPKVPTLALLGVLGSGQTDPGLANSLQQFAVSRMTTEKDNVLKRQALLSLALMSSTNPATVEAVLSLYETNDNLWVTFPVPMFFQYHAAQIRQLADFDAVRARVEAVPSLYTAQILADLGPAKKAAFRAMRVAPVVEIRAGQGLASVPEDLLARTDLRQLSLRRNSLTFLPADFARLQGLRALDLADNRLADLPESLASLGQLRHLELRGNAFTSFPAVLLSMPDLETLDLSDNALTELPPGLSAMTGLQVLVLRHNRLASLPPSLSQMRGLRVLELEGNPLSAEQVEALRKALPGTTINL